MCNYYLIKEITTEMLPLLAIPDKNSFIYTISADN